MRALECPATCTVLCHLGFSQGQLGSTQSQGLVPCIVFVLKEMLPNYHKWRYNSHGVREQIGKPEGSSEVLVVCVRSTHFVRPFAVIQVAHLPFGASFQFIPVAPLGLGERRDCAALAGGRADSPPLQSFPTLDAHRILAGGGPSHFAGGARERLKSRRFATMPCRALSAS